MLLKGKHRKLVELVGAVNGNNDNPLQRIGTFEKGVMWNMGPAFKSGDGAAEGDTLLLS